MKKTKILALLLSMTMLLSTAMPGTLAIESAVDEGEPTYVCGFDYEHQHDEVCYETELLCTEEETEGHTHGDDCYTVETVVTCTLTEEPHEHTDECEEGCEITVENVHGDDCYAEEKTLICEQEESEPHQHDDDCYGEPVLSCGYAEEHEHTDECYPVEEVEVCEYCSEEIESCVCCAECGEINGHLETCSLYEEPIEKVPEIIGPQVGDKIWIKSGSKVYKTQTVENGWELWGNYEVEIVNVITDGTGNVVMYEFEFTSLGIGEILLHDFKYVLVENTSVEEPDETEPSEPETDELGIPLCDCKDAEDITLVNHADDCARKDYLRNIYIVEMTAEEIYIDWEMMNEDTQNAVLEFLSWDDQVKYAELNALLNNAEKNEFVLPDGLTVRVEGEGLPEDLLMLVEEETDDYAKNAIIDDINQDFLDEVDSTPERNLEFYRSFNIKLYSDGTEWQPNGAKVMVTIDSLGVDLSFCKIVVNHLLDTSEAVSRALENGTAIAYQADGLDQIYPDETAASGSSDTIYYVQLTNNEDDEGCCDVFVNDDDSISFYLDSFSTVQISASSLHTEPYMPDIESTNAADKLVLNKTVEYNDDDGTYTLNMEAYSTGRTEAKDTEVVLILDHSGSMYSSVDGESYTYTQFMTLNDTEHGKYEGYYFAVRKDPDSSKKYSGALVRYNTTTNKWQRTKEIEISESVYKNLQGGLVFLDKNLNDWYNITETSAYGPSHNVKFYQTIYGAMIDALHSFSEKVEGVENCKVAVVGFASSPADGVKEDGDRKRGGTGIYVNGELVPYTKCTNATYTNSWMAVDTDNGIKMLETTFSNVLTDYHATTTNAGFILANKIFEASDDARKTAGNTGDVNRVVILFTDGEPTAYVTNPETGATKNDGDITDASKNPAIDVAFTTKNTYEASVYAYGPSAGAQVSKTFLDRLSSNYPTAKDMTSNYSKDSDNYAGLAANAADLAKSFAEIGQMIVDASTTLNADTVLRDIVSSDFEIVYDENEKPVVSAYSVPYTTLTNGSFGFDHNSATSLTGVTINEQTVEVTGFEYNNNIVYIDPNNEPQGAKLLVSVKIKPAASYTGNGQDVATNGAGSGVFDESGEIILPFKEPKVDLFTNVYVQKIVDGSQNMIANDKFTFNGTYHQFSSYQNDEEDTEENSQGGNTLNANTTEKTINRTDIMHDDIFPLEKVMIGSDLVIYELENEDYEVSVTVNGKSVTADNEGKFTIPVTDTTMDIVFTNTAKLVDLTITKQIEDGTNPDQSFMFEVSGNGIQDMVVVIPAAKFQDGTASVTIASLLVGEYTVTELTDWSWRYAIDDENAVEKTVNLTSSGGSVEFTNKRDQNYWLSGDCYVENWFTSERIVKRDGENNKIGANNEITD